jgi:chemotaxis protein MotB
MGMHRRKSNDDGRPVCGSDKGWQTVYTGFALIMLCFFIMLTSFASLQQSKITRFAKSFSNAVTVFDGGRSLEPGETMISRDVAMVDKENQLALLFEKVNLQGRMAGLKDLDVRKSPKGVVITLADKMLFPSGKAIFSEKAHPLLRKITAIIQNLKVPVEIEGHTDDLPIKSADYPSNWELSTARAVNVLRYMAEKEGVEMNLLSALGKSRYHPVVPNISVENRSRNRRVEIIFKPESSE